ncbi:MAG: hypothetical protein H6760_03480 [Candidatus Nomurabacteria bacterium]|nr:MAG: hypothetical protein H6760_03480 [Candidatus Nomurabacteria bacterium]
MPLHIQPSIFHTYPDFRCGVIVAKGIENTKEKIDLPWDAMQQELVKHFDSYEAPSRHPHILAWRQAYKTFGTDPQKYRCSVEALVRRTLKGEPPMHINALVDIYNYISLKYVVPIGGEDLDAVQGAIVLDQAKGDEPFIRLGGEENEPPDPGEVVYKDELGVLCRRWNWREADRTKLTESTRNAILEIETLGGYDATRLQAALDECTKLIQEHCGGEVHVQVLDKEQATAVC